MDGNTIATFQWRWYWRAIAFAVGFLCGLLTTGCGTVQPGAWWQSVTNAVSGESQHSENGGSSTPTSSQTTTTTTVPASGEYDLTLRVTGLTSSKVRFDWSPRNYGWPVQTVKVPVDAVAHMYRADGSGGKFDWIRKGGQSEKGLENIHHGYGGHTIPAPGERVTFRWVSVDGKRRSNDAEAVWP